MQLVRQIAKVIYGSHIYMKVTYEALLRQITSAFHNKKEIITGSHGLQYMVA